MQSIIFKITMKSNVATANVGSTSCQSFNATLINIGGFLYLKAFICIYFQTSKNWNGANVKVNGRWMNIFHLLFHEIKVEELFQWAPKHCCWDVFPNFLHFEYHLIWHNLRWF
jgi:hypothetical protein